MGLYNFQKRFVPMILDGSKTHTIRAPRTHPDKVGNTLYLYTGLRQKGARLLLRAVCTKIEEIRIYSNCQVSIDATLLDFDERQQLARCDGFKDFADMMVFWNGRRPFVGSIIHWRKENS
jgi:hypothetical protein